MLDAYNRANPVNMLVVGCVAQHLAGTVDMAAAAPPAFAWQPPAAPAPLWPSLYRHLTHWPAMLGYASVLVVPEFAAIDASAARLREQGARAAAELARRIVPPRGVAPPAAAQRAGLQSAIDRFSVRIPEMVVIGTLLRRALPPELPLNERGSN